MKHLITSAFLLALLLPCTALAQTNTLVAGIDYELITDPKPFDPLNGKIEVVEVFGYSCNHCARFQPQITDWARKQPADVRFTSIPAAFGGYWIPFARAYYAAKNLGVLKQSHQAMFDAVHQHNSIPVVGVSPAELASVYIPFGVPEASFITALQDPIVDVQLDKARDFAIRTGVEGTPSVIVNGKYLVKGRSFNDILRIADALIVQERTANTK